MISRYAKILHTPDQYTCDVVYVDRTTGREVLKYDGADPANTRPEYGAISDVAIFEKKGLIYNERVDESKCVKDESWIHRYVTSDALWRDDY